MSPTASWTYVKRPIRGRVGRFLWVVVGGREVGHYAQCDWSNSPIQLVETNQLLLSDYVSSVVAETGVRNNSDLWSL